MNSDARPILQEITPHTKADNAEQGYVYHITNLERATEIAQEGSMLTHLPWDHTEQDMWPDGSEGSRIYFGETTNLYHFAPEEGQAVLLRMKRREQHKRDGSTPDLYLERNVQSSELEALTREGSWAPLSDLAVDKPSQDHGFSL